MVFNNALQPSGSSALVSRVVKQHRVLSIEGFLEKLFAAAFSELVYPQIWEDPVVDLAAMEIQPHHHIVAIASGGCNVMSYLTQSPARITAVDLNRAHVALTRLKLSGASQFNHWASFHRFFADADDKENIFLYNQFLKPVLDLESRRYWEGRDRLGRPRLKGFTSNIYRKGLLGRFITMGHWVSKAYGVNLRRLLDCDTIEDQRRVYDEYIAPLFQKRAVKWATNHRMSLYGLGIPPAQYSALSGGRPMAEVLRERLEHLACDFPLSSNYFAWQAFGRSYAPEEEAARPPYLERGNFETIKSNAARVQVLHASLTDTLNAMQPASADRFVLLDAQDWMNDVQLNELWAAISRTSTKGARVIFRTAGENTVLPGRVAPQILDRWDYLEMRSRELGKQDRSSIYGGFHVYERIG
jgi:S-adenosylmethionine-diacylglycerol 3-amino-3-carboxypropyl transferase